MPRNYFLFGGLPMPEEVIVEIVDEVLVSLLGAAVPPVQGAY